MTENSAFPTTLTGQLRCLIDAVRESCGLHGPRGLFALPMALWMWVRSRRMRREIEAAARQFAALAETLVALLEDFRAGRLPPLPPPRGEVDQRAGGVDGAAGYPPPSRIGPPFLPAKMGSVAGPSSVRFAAQPLRGRGIQGAEGADHAAAPATPTAGFPARGGHVGPPTQWIPVFAGMTGAVGAGGAMVGLGSGCCRNDGRTFNFYRRKWRISGFVARAPPEGRLRKSRRRRRGLLRRNSC